MLHVLRIIFCSLLSWLLIAGGITLYILLVKETDSPWFVTFHYALDIFVVWLIFDQYFRRFEHYSAIGTMIIALIFLNLIEYFFWKFFYKGPLELINFTHFFVPLILVGVTIYLIGRQYKHVK